MFPEMWGQDRVQLMDRIFLETQTMQIAIIYQAFIYQYPSLPRLNPLLITSAHLEHIYDTTLSVSAVFVAVFKQVHGKHNRELPFDHLFVILAAGFDNSSQGVLLTKWLRLRQQLP